MAGLARRVAFAAVVCAACVGAFGVGQSSAARWNASTSAQKALDEIANEAGYRTWGAYMAARAAAEEAREKEAWKIVADALTYGRRVEESYMPGIRLFFEYVIDFNAGAYFLRSGIEYEDPGFLGFGAKTTRITTYWQGLKPVGVVTSVIKDGVETVTGVNEYEPGGLDVKVGDEQPAPKPSSSAAGLRPRTIDPKKDGSLGTSSGGTAPLAGVLDAIVAKAEQERQSSDQQGSGSRDGSGGNTANQEPAPGSESTPGAGGEPAPETTPKEGGSEETGQQEGHWVWSEPLHDDLTGQTFTGYVYENADGTNKAESWGVKTEEADGTTSCKSSTTGEEMECPSGMTDEPSCTSDCYRLALLTQLFSCTDGTACANAIPQDPKAATAPKDSGDPNDPNAPQNNIDWGNLFGNDGVTDPANPGEDEETFQASIAQDMFGSLRDPVHPPGSDEPPPGRDPHNPGDSE